MVSRRPCVVLAVLVFATPAAADDISYQLETSVASNYVYRGIVQYSTHTAPSSQNTAAVTFDHVGDGTLTLVAWNATALSDYGNQPGNSLEFDFSAGYTIHRGALALTAGYMAYLYPNHMAGTPMDGAHEVSAVASYETPYVTPIAGAYVEFVRQGGAYLMFGATHDFKLGDWTLAPTASIGGAAYRHYLGGDQSASPHINDVTAAVAGKYDIARGVYAIAKVSYSLRGTPSDLAPMMGWGFDGRSSIYGVVAVGLAR
jgi:uncharacterized protein Gcw-chp